MVKYVHMWVFGALSVSAFSFAGCDAEMSQGAAGSSAGINSKSSASYDREPGTITVTVGGADGSRGSAVAPLITGEGGFLPPPPPPLIPFPGDDSGSTGDVDCEEDEIECVDECVNPDTDRDNCGDCEFECADEEACVAGVCTVACGPGETNCEGECIDLSNDQDHCGTCGNACAVDISCCDGACIDTMVDLNNCDTCGTICPANNRCFAGACEDCGMLTECNNSCVDTMVDVDNCGSCGTMCADGEVCSGGTCVTP